jgi:hypothetical protein
MPKVFKAIIASTFSSKTQYDIRRTPYVFSQEAILEINKQINLLKDNGTPIEVLLQAPERDKITNEKKPNIVIGKIVGCEVIHEQKLECFQCKASILIENDSAIGSIENNKNDLVFFPNIAYSETKSLKNAVITESNADNVYYLYPPLKIVAMNLGAKRSSSNPYLNIL